MRTILTAFIAGASIAVAGCSTLAPMAGPAGMDMTPEDRANYVMMAAASDLFEIQSSQIALSKAQRPDVRQFAQMMIQHHTMTTNQLMAAARASGLNPPPPMLLPMQREMIERLQAASPATIDELYMEQQVAAHQMAAALHGNYARSGDTPALRTAAAAAVPIVTQHLARARQLD